MNKTCEICLPLLENYEKIMAMGDILAITDKPGLAWNQANDLKDLWWKTPVADRMDIMYAVIHELNHHVGTMFELSTRSVSVLSMTNYDGSGISPVIGGLNGEHLSSSNPFGNKEVSFPQAKSPLIEFASERYRAYKAELNQPSYHLRAYVADLREDFDRARSRA